MTRKAGEKVDPHRLTQRATHRAARSVTPTLSRPRRREIEVVFVQLGGRPQRPETSACAKSAAVFRIGIGTPMSMVADDEVTIISSPEFVDSDAVRIRDCAAMTAQVRV